MNTPLPNEPVPTTAPDKAGVFEDFVDIFYAPAAVYERRRAASAWLPIIVTTLVVGLGYIASSGAMQPILDAEFARSQAAMASNPQITPEMIEQMRSVGTTIAAVQAFIGVPIAVAIIGLVLHLAGKLVDATQPVRASIMIAAYAFVPRMLQAVLVPVQLRFMSAESLDGIYRLSASPARFMDPDTTAPIMLALASRADVFVLWTTALLAIGLSVVARIPRAQAWIAALLVWVAGAVPYVWPALMA